MLVSGFAVEAEFLETGAEFLALFDLLGGEAQTEAAVGKAELELGDEVFVIESTFGEVVTGSLVFGEKKTVVIVVHDLLQKFGVGGFRSEKTVERAGFLGFGGDRFALVLVEKFKGVTEGEAVDAFDELDGVSSGSAAETVEKAFVGSDNEVGSVLVVVKGTESDEVFGTVFFEFDASGTDKSDKIHLFLEAADFGFRDSGHKKCQVGVVKINSVLYYSVLL